MISKSRTQGSLYVASTINQVHKKVVAVIIIGGIHLENFARVDDGIRTIEESLAVLAYFESLGVKKVRLTPHVMNGVEPVSYTHLDVYKRQVY